MNAKDIKRLMEENSIKFWDVCHEFNHFWDSEYMGLEDEDQEGVNDLNIDDTYVFEKHGKMFTVVCSATYDIAEQEIEEVEE